MNAASPIVGRGLRKDFRRGTGEAVHALDRVSLEAHHGTLTAVVGPDGAGKTTLMRLVAGLIAPDAGDLSVLDCDVAADPQRVQDRIGYMPQKFGLYEDLTVQENMDLYADLHGIEAEERTQQYRRLLEMTALGRFTNRLAGKLSGGMKQKLGLACTLVRSPQLILLDEPTVGVDPVSRRELWEIILGLVKREGMTVLVSTSYLDEAERCDHAVVLHSGQVLDQGPPKTIADRAADRTFIADPPAGLSARGLQARLLQDSEIVDAVPEAGRVRIVLATKRDQKPDAGLFARVNIEPIAPRFEDGFMMLLRNTVRDRPSSKIGLADSKQEAARDVVVEVRDLVRCFGNFTAVDHVSFDVKRGEIFGLLGPNGAGKTTTFRMLCGLLPVTSGTLRVAGTDLRSARASARQHVGYVAQKFSLYGQLTVGENLGFFASAYGLRGDRRRERIAWAMEEFELTRVSQLPSMQLPGGYKQRLAMAAALLHEPEILFLDEPTSGADPMARREFWQRITALAEGGVAVVVTTHFMEEAEYCDNAAILDAGRILAIGAPAEIRARGRSEQDRQPSMEDAFIAIVGEARSHQTERIA